MFFGPVASTTSPFRSLLLNRTGLHPSCLPLHPLCRPRRAPLHEHQHTPSGIMSNHLLLRLGATGSGGAGDFRIQAPNVDVQEVRRQRSGSSGGRPLARGVLPRFPCPACLPPLKGELQRPRWQGLRWDKTSLWAVPLFHTAAAVSALHVLAAGPWLVPALRALPRHLQVHAAPLLCALRRNRRQKQCSMACSLASPPSCLAPPAHVSPPACLACPQRGCRCAATAPPASSRLTGSATRTPPPAPQVPEYLKRDCLLFYYPDCEQLARRIVECSEGRVELAEINWK